MWSMFIYVLSVAFCLGVFILMMKSAREKVTLGAFTLATIGALIPFLNTMLGVLFTVMTIVMLIDFGFFNKVLFDFRERSNE